MKGCLQVGMLLCVIFAVASCDFLGSETRELEHEDIRISFSISEQVLPEDREPKMVLAMASRDTLFCHNYNIVNKFGRSGDQLELHVLGVDLPNGVCQRGMAPASAQRVLDLSPGTYWLSIRNREATDRHRVKIRRDAVHVKSVRAKISEPKAALFWHYPRRSFVFLCGTLAEDKHLCSDFDARLQKQLDLETIEAPEEGVWPYPRRNQENYQGQHYDAPAHYYRYENEEDFEQAGNLLREYTQSVLNQKSWDNLVLRNWRGEAYRSWVIEDES